MDPTQPPQDPPAQPQKRPEWVGGVAILLACFFGCGILAAILLPIFQGARPISHGTSQLSQAKQISDSMMIYLADFDDQFPPMMSALQISKDISPYIKNEELLHAAERMKWNDKLSLAHSETVLLPATVWMLHEPNPIEGQTTTCFVDSGCKRVSDSDLWQITTRPLEFDKKK